ncbi:MAG: AraC family transcriptional regulator [Clostridiales bacterium]|nr:AraC family transcriptional regulator [Roseburia sp.]MDD7638279.1 AraC family transcriptional regulator [Clostridiales bacterium]MDY4113211.1 AraC family transcriptional regulator [Roseburia sp.]
MQQELLEQLQKITEEEKRILDGELDIRKELYTSKKDFVIDSKKLLEKGRLIEIRPHTRFAHFPKHRHNYVEMVYMCSGNTTHIINGTETIVLNEGDLLFLNQNVTQEILPAGKDDIAVNFIILPEFFDRTISMIERENVLRDFLLSTLSADNSTSSYLHFQAKDILPVQNLLENMIWTIICRKSGTNTINQTTMGLLFLNLSLFADNINQNNPNQYEQNLVFSVLKYIETHYKNGTLEDISTELKQPTYYVSRLLKKHTNANFKELLQQRKLQQAAYLLTQTPLTVEAVMEAIGYDNSSYFYRKFREKYGCSPRNYRSSLSNSSKM